jgi:hypothetical protein
MLATLVHQPFDRSGWLFEIKWDGYRAIAEVDKGQVPGSKSGLRSDRSLLRDCPGISGKVGSGKPLPAAKH